MTMKQLVVYMDDTDSEDPGDTWKETFCPIDETTGYADEKVPGLYRCGGGHAWKWVEKE